MLPHRRSASVQSGQAPNRAVVEDTTRWVLGHGRSRDTGSLTGGSEELHPGHMSGPGAVQSNADQLLSSRTLTVSMSCSNEVALPRSKVHTCAVFTEAGWPVLLWFHDRCPSATTVSRSLTNCSGTTAKSAPIWSSR